MPDIPDSARLDALLAALIVPNAARRRSLATALAASQFTVAKEYGDWPSGDDLRGIALLNCRAAFVDVDDDIGQAIRVIEGICRHDLSMTVMAFSGRSDPNLILRAMQAGAREFLIEPITPDTLREAFSRASIRLNSHPVLGKVLVFVPRRAAWALRRSLLILRWLLQRSPAPKWWSWIWISSLEKSRSDLE